MAQDAAAALVAICDQAAASPFDKNRPSGVAGVPPDKVDPKIAIPACEAALKVSPNDPRIFFQLARAYSAGKAYESARAQYLKADEIGYPLAANNLAEIYGDGLGVPVDQGRALAFLVKAAEAGMGMAMRNLGARYRDGFGVPKDYNIARNWFKKAIEYGSIDALQDYGHMLRLGQGGTIDLITARRVFQKAADLGDADSMYDFGVMLWHGRGGPSDGSLAMKWIEKAARLNNSGAIEYLGKRRTSNNARRESGSPGGGYQSQCPAGRIPYGSMCVFPCAIGPYASC